MRERTRRTSDGAEPLHVPETRPGQAGGKRDQNRRARTQGLCDAAEKLFLARGIESVSIDDITKEAGVAKGSFYRYFSGGEQDRGGFEAVGTLPLVPVFGVNWKI